MLDLTAIDESLLKQGVKFLPWIGENFEEGFHGQRLLILGESHYDFWTDPDGIARRNALSKTFTRECIAGVIARDNDAAKFWRALEQALLNERRENGWAPRGGAVLWNQFCFYNFVQFPIEGGARIRPTHGQFVQSRPQFRSVLEQLQPTRVLVCGKQLWKKMENIIEPDAIISDDIQAYDLANGDKA